MILVATFDNSRSLEDVIRNFRTTIQGLEERSGAARRLLPFEESEELLSEEFDFGKIGEADLGEVIIGISEGFTFEAVNRDAELLALLVEDGVSGEGVGLQETVRIAEVRGEEETNLRVDGFGFLSTGDEGFNTATVDVGADEVQESSVDFGLAEKTAVRDINGCVVPALSEEGAGNIDAQSGGASGGADDAAGNGRKLEATEHS